MILLVCSYLFLLADTKKTTQHNLTLKPMLDCCPLEDIAVEFVLTDLLMASSKIF